MTEVKTYCDHCGKVLDEMHDYPDTEIGVVKFLKADLCNKCINELDNRVRRFVKKEGGEG